MSTKKRSIQEMLGLFSDLLSPEDVIYAKLSAEVSTLLSKERIKRHMTQSEFASFLGVQQSQISKWEHGTDNLSLKAISKLAAKLDLDISINAVSRSAIHVPDSINTVTYGASFTRIIKTASESFKTRTIGDPCRMEMTKIC